jgi:predicted nicotinamide N-methyase
MWRPYRIGERAVEVLDFEHPEVSAKIIPDIEAGTEVYYDRRWRVSEQFAALLERDPALVRDRTVLVLGCGVGLEALAAAPYVAHLYLNDLSRTAVELSRAQLEHNGWTAHTPLVGRFEEIALPAFDLAIGSFLVFDDETRESMLAFMSLYPQPVLLANDPMGAFEDVLVDSGRRIRRLSGPEERPIIWFEAT